MRAMRDEVIQQSRATAPFSDNPHGHSAVDHEVLSGDEVIFNQGRDQRSNILRRTFFVQRNPVLDIVPGLCRRKSIMKGGTNDTGRNTVDADTLVGKFAAQNAGELRQRAFHHTVSERAQAAS